MILQPLWTSCKVPCPTSVSQSQIVDVTRNDKFDCSCITRIFHTMIAMIRCVDLADSTDGQFRPWPPALREAGGDLQTTSARYAIIFNTWHYTTSIYSNL